MRVEGLTSFAENAGTTIFQLISTTLKDSQGLFHLDEPVQSVAASTVPVDVRMSSRLSALSAIANGAEATITSALSRSQAVGGYLERVKDVLSQLESLRMEAAASGGSAALDQAFQAKLSELDRFWRDASYNGDHVLRGGSAEITDASSGQTFTVSNGDAARQRLGLESAEIGTAEGVEAATAALSGAKEDIAGQIQVSTNEQAALSSRLADNAGTQGSANAASSSQLSSEKLFSGLAQAKKQILENMRAAMTYQAALLAPELMDRLVGHFSTGTTQARSGQSSVAVQTAGLDAAAAQA